MPTTGNSICERMSDARSSDSSGSRCTEKTVAVLFSRFKDVLGPVAMTMLSASALEPRAPEQLAAMGITDVLLRDAMYCFAGVTAHDLHEAVQFDSWFANVLVHDAGTAHLSAQKYVPGGVFV